MNPCNNYLVLADQIIKGFADFEILSTGEIHSYESEIIKSGAQRKTDVIALSAARKILKNISLTKEESEYEILGRKIVTNLTLEIGEGNVEKVLEKILKASEFLAGGGIKCLRTNVPMISPRIKQRKSIFMEGFSEVRPEVQRLQGGLNFDLKNSDLNNAVLFFEDKYTSSETFTSSETSSDEPEYPNGSIGSYPPAPTPLENRFSQSVSPKFYQQLQLAPDVYPSQEKLKKLSPPRLDSKKMKSLEEKILNNPFLGPDAFKTHVKQGSCLELNASSPPSYSGGDIFRYLQRNGITLSKSGEKNTFVFSEAGSKDEHIYIAERFVKLIVFLIKSLPGLAADRIQTLCEQVELEFSSQIGDSSLLQSKIQNFIVRNRKEDASQETQLISKILQAFVQNAPNMIAVFIQNVGVLHSMNLERLPQEFCLHLEEEVSRLYIIYTTYFKNRAPNNRSVTGDPIKILIDSKVVFYLDLKDPRPEWSYDRQTLSIGCPEKHKSKDKAMAETLFNTFSVLGMEPSKCICPAIVPEKLSRC